MTQDEIIKAFKLAEKHYSRPEWLCKIIGYNHTKLGICDYFELEQNYRPYTVEKELTPLWIKYRTTPDNNIYHFNNREERLRVIRMVMKDLTGK